MKKYLFLAFCLILPLNAFADSFSINSDTYTGDSSSFSFTQSNANQFCWWYPDDSWGGTFGVGETSGSGTFSDFFGSGIEGFYHVGGFETTNGHCDGTWDYPDAYADAAIYFDQVSPLTAGAFEFIAGGEEPDPPLIFDPIYAIPFSQYLFASSTCVQVSDDPITFSCTATSTTLDQPTYSDWLLGLSILVFLLSFITWGVFFNPFKPKI